MEAPIPPKGEKKDIILLCCKNGSNIRRQAYPNGNKNNTNINYQKSGSKKKKLSEKES